LKEYENKVEIEVRTTIIPSLIYRKEDLAGIAEIIKNLKCMWILQGFKTDYGASEKKLANLNAPSKNFLEILKDFIVKEYSNIKISIRT
jgi:pyruvate-formate lyase-activating enzyme